MRILLAILAILSFSQADCALSGDLVYTPVSPSFGGSPLNSSHLMGLATAQNEFKKSSAASPFAQQSAAERFSQQLQAQLYANLAQKVSNAIFGENAQDHGTFKFADQTISFLNDGTQVTLTITNTTTGAVTEISVPSGALTSIP